MWIFGEGTGEGLTDNALLVVNPATLIFIPKLFGDSEQCFP